MKLGFIGYGNMASAIIGGTLQSKTALPRDVLVCDPMAEKMEAAQKLGLVVQNDNVELTKNADMIFLCVKPKDFTAILAEIKPVLTSQKVLVSIAAGISIQMIEQNTSGEMAVVRVMPNTPLLLGKGTTAVCRNAHVTDDAFNCAKAVFRGAGTVYELEEDKFDHVINLNGSSPAYIYLFAKTIAEFASEQGGIPYDTALSMLCDTLHGAADMLQHTGKSADELIRAVSSPGGTTVAALQTFEKVGFAEALQQGCAACVERARQMTEEYEQ